MFINRLLTTMMPLASYVDKAIFRGVTTGLNEAFVIDEVTRERLIAEDDNSALLIMPFVSGKSVKKYGILAPTEYIIFARRGIDIENFPAILRHLSNFRDQLEPKPPNWKGRTWQGRKAGKYKWYEIQGTANYWRAFHIPKIILPDISLRGNFTYDAEGVYLANTAYMIPVDDKYLLGLLNSKLMTFVYQRISSTYRGGYLRFTYRYLGKLPVRTIDFGDPEDEQLHDEMVGLVESMLDLHKQLPGLSGAARRVVELRIEATDRAIDALVYQLYGLSDDEVRVVEGG